MITVSLQEYITQLFHLKPMITLLALAALAVILFVIGRKTTFNTRTIAYGALSIAAAFVLSYFRIFKLPNGGTITIASMLPIFIFAYIAGTGAGLTAGLCYGLLQFIQDPYYVHWVQFILDYLLAFSVLGLAGLFRKNLFAGAVVGSFARLVCHFLSGVIFFAEYAGGQNVYLYSFLYNASYLVPDMLICLFILLVPNLRTALKRLQSVSV